MQRVIIACQVVVALVAVATTSPALATKLVVGGSQGWDLATDLSSWASSTTFIVGDQLVFKYTPGLHSVAELAGEKEYSSCSMEGALNSMNGGTSTVKLSKPGYRYLACGTAGHCEQGMKVKIKTIATSDAAASQSSTLSSSASTSLSCVGFSCAFVVFIVASMFFGFFYTV